MIKIHTVFLLSDIISAFRSEKTPPNQINMACLFVHEIQPTPGEKRYILPAMKQVEMVGFFSNVCHEKILCTSDNSVEMAMKSFASFIWISNSVQRCHRLGGFTSLRVSNKEYFQVFIIVLFKSLVNTWRLRQNDHHFPDDILKYTVFIGNVQISIKILLFLRVSFTINQPWFR